MTTMMTPPFGSTTRPVSGPSHVEIARSRWEEAKVVVEALTVRLERERRELANGTPGVLGRTRVTELLLADAEDAEERAFRGLMGERRPGFRVRSTAAVSGRGTR